MRQRFRVNKHRSTTRQMQTLKKEIIHVVLQLTQMVRKKLAWHVRQSTVSLLTCYVYLRDVVTNLMKEKVQSKDEFLWQIQFKFELKGLLNVIWQSAYFCFRDTSKSIFETQKLEVEFEVFNISRRYGFEYLGNCPRLIISPLTERCQRSLLVALQYHYGGAPEGPFGTGKTETSKDLSRSIAKLCIVMNCSSNYEYFGICRFFKGLASSGAWVCFDEFNRMKPLVLSMISQVMITLQSALKSGAKTVYLEDARVNLRHDCAVFITLNPGYAGRSVLPMSLKALFRSVSMVVPDSLLITQNLLYSSGFIQAQQLSQKIVLIQQLASKFMSSTDTPDDFGLRSIKAIVNAAEALKLQIIEVVDCAHSEMIDDESMNTVSHQPERMINEIMMQSQRRLNERASSRNSAYPLDNSEEGSRPGS